LLTDGSGNHTELWKKNSHDRIRRAIDCRMLPEDSQITIEAAVPEPVAQNHDAILARNGIGWK
jgi:hypothetical protein